MEILIAENFLSWEKHILLEILFCIPYSYLYSKAVLVSPHSFKGILAYQIDWYQFLLAENGYYGCDCGMFTQVAVYFAKKEK